MGEKYLRYRLEIEYRPQDKVLRVKDEDLRALRSDGSIRSTKSRSPFISRHREPDGRDVLRLRLEGQASRPQEFEIGLPYTIISRPHYAPHYPHIDAFKREVEGWRFYYLEPRVMRADNDLNVASLPGHYGEDLAAFFDTLRARNPRQFAAMQKALTGILPIVKEVDVERDSEGLIRLVVREDAITYSARVMSEGTLRLLGLLAIVQPHSPAVVVGFEEPENGVHPRRIDAVARVLESVGRAGAFQVIVNTHSPLLAQQVPEESLVICRKGPEGTTFVRAAPLGLYKEQAISEALTPDEEDAGQTSLTERVTRGDFGG